MSPADSNDVGRVGRDQLERDYTPLDAVPDNEAYITRGVEQSRKVRETLRCTLDVPYGETALETLDIFYSGRDDAPIVIFFHGGYWYSLDKSDYSYIAGPLAANGADSVLVNYDLCPGVTLDVVVSQCLKAVAWVYRTLASGKSSRRIFVCGNSAGGHLAAMALARDWTLDGLPADILAGAFCVTGIYDIRPVPLISANQFIGLTADIALRNSPMFLEPRTNAPILIAVGADETAGWIKQSLDYAGMLRGHDVPVEVLVMPGENHFSIAESLGNPESVLVAAIASRLHASQ